MRRRLAHLLRPNPGQRSSNVTTPVTGGPSACKRLSRAGTNRGRLFGDLPPSASDPWHCGARRWPWPFFNRFAGRAEAAEATNAPPTSPPRPYTPVITPDGSSLPFVLKDGVKEFHLVAEPVKREFAPGVFVNCWGYNGQTPGPTIEAVEGDRVRILVTNKLPEPTTVHWHGLITPNGMDGVAGVTQKAIPPGETYAYEFPLVQHGTQMYHPHADEMIQMAMGMEGFFIIHPKGRRTRTHRPGLLHLPPGMGGRAGHQHAESERHDGFQPVHLQQPHLSPARTPLVVKKGDRVRVRLANLSMDSHPIHFHGHVWETTYADGGPIPKSARWPSATSNVPPGTTRTMEFVADNPGDWPFHCHKNHHAMNAMTHDIPNVIGADQPKKFQAKMNQLVPGSMNDGREGTFDMTDMNMGLPRNTAPMMAGKGPFGPVGMGGMFTLLKVRETLPKGYDADPGWYEHPPGTVAGPVGADGRPWRNPPDRRGRRGQDGWRVLRTPASCTRKSCRTTPATARNAGCDLFRKNDGRRGGAGSPISNAILVSYENATPAFVRRAVRSGVRFVASTVPLFLSAADPPSADAEKFLVPYEQVLKALVDDNLQAAKEAAHTLPDNAGGRPRKRQGFEGGPGGVRHAQPDGREAGRRAYPGYHVFYCPMAKKDWVQQTADGRQPLRGQGDADLRRGEENNASRLPASRRLDGWRDGGSNNGQLP